ncbi:MAG: RDD family protein [Erysipelotrichaceae bacterium]|nr:RDD family protein [Erysipelotrichaceae bacterium]MDY5252725.1 RDD family protein [Erysipelotrichaceae bacterium]
MKAFAYLVRRFFAFGADWYISAILINLLTNGLSKLLLFKDGIYVAIIISSLVVAYIYFVLVPTKIWQGQTLMKRAMYLQVVNEDDSLVRRKELFLRYFVGCMTCEGVFYIPSSNVRSALLIMFPNLQIGLQVLNFAMIAGGCVSILIAMLDKKREFRMLHDRLFHTKVTNLEKIS